MDRDFAFRVLGPAYARLGVPLDQLPYTEAFDSLYSEVMHSSTTLLSKHEVWCLLASTRKRSYLPRLAR